MSTFVTETSFSVYGMMFRIVTAKILYKNKKNKKNKKESRKLIFRTAIKFTYSLALT